VALLGCRSGLVEKNVGLLKTGLSAWAGENLSLLIGSPIASELGIAQNGPRFSFFEYDLHRPLTTRQLMKPITTARRKKEMAR
jgi:hypothetical protein